MRADRRHPPANARAEVAPRAPTADCRPPVANKTAHRDNAAATNHPRRRVCNTQRRRHHKTCCRLESARRNYKRRPKIFNPVRGGARCLAIAGARRLPTAIACYLWPLSHRIASPHRASSRGHSRRRWGARVDPPHGGGCKVWRPARETRKLRGARCWRRRRRQPREPKAAATVDSQFLRVSAAPAVENWPLVSSAS